MQMLGGCITLNKVTQCYTTLMVDPFKFQSWPNHQLLYYSHRPLGDPAMKNQKQAYSRDTQMSNYNPVPLKVMLLTNDTLIHSIKKTNDI